MSLDIIRIRRDTFANWDSENPTLSLGEISYDLTNKQIRVGDGSTAWLDLQPIGNSTLADGDYGDIVVSASGTTIELDSAIMDLINGKLDQGPLDGGSPTTVGQVLRIRKGTTASWSGVVLSSGEIGYDTVLHELKIGDGTTVWGTLPTIGAAATSINLNALTDVTITSPSSGQTLIYSAGQWSNQTAPTPILPINSLSDVVITAPMNTQLLQFNGTNWVNSFPVTTEPLVTAGEKNHINVVGVDTDWRIMDNVVTQDMLALTSPVNPEDAATKGYADSTIGMAITSAVTEKLNQSNGIAGLGSTGKLQTSSLPYNSLVKKHDLVIKPNFHGTDLAYTREQAFTTGQRRYFTDGSGEGTFVYSTYSASNITSTGYAPYTRVSDNSGSYITVDNHVGQCGRVRHKNAGFGGLVSDNALLDEYPSFFAATVKYDGQASNSHFAWVGHCANHAVQSQFSCNFFCKGTTNWIMKISNGYTTTYNANGQPNSANTSWENVLYYVDSGIPVNEWATLGIRIVRNNHPRLGIPSTTAPDGIYFYRLQVPEEVGGQFGDINDERWTLLGYYSLVGTTLKDLDLETNNEPTAVCGIELRRRNVGSYTGDSVHLYHKDMVYMEYFDYLDLARASHTHSLSNLTQSSATTGQVPTWDGSAWIPATPSGGSGGGVTDGDKGDIVVSGSGTTWTIDTNVITTSKILNQAVTSAKIAPSAINASKMASNSVGMINLIPSGELDGSIYYTTNDGSYTNILKFSPTFVVNEGVSPAQLNLADQSVTYAKIQNISATDKLLGRSSSGAGVVEEISCTAAGRALIDDATAADQRTTLGLGTMATQAASSVNITGGTLADVVTVTTGSITNPVNQAIVKHARKASAGTITAGQLVYVTGATGNHVAVELAKADAEATSSTTFGIAMDTITNSVEGHVLIQGLLTGIDTNAFTEGNALWLSASTAGAYTATKPTQPNHGVFIGWVTKKAAAGEIYIKIQNGYELSEIHDVLISSAATGHLLTWDNTAGLWKNQVLSDASITANTISGTKLADTTVAVAKINATGTPGSGNFLRGDGQWATPTAGAPTNATYIVQTADGTLTNEQVLGSLATGILKNTTTTGVLSIATGSDLPSHTHAASDITSGVIATARLGTGTQDTTTFLRGDGTWQSVSGSGMTFQQSLRIAALL